MQTLWQDLRYGARMWMKKLCLTLALSTLLMALPSQSRLALAQLAVPAQSQPDQKWVGQRIILLRGFGEIHAPESQGKEQRKRLPNIVAPVVRVEGERVWVIGPGGIEPAGWVEPSEALLLADAIPHFTALLERNPQDWDAWFRRAEAKHALNQRNEAIADYSRAIQLRPNDPFLYLRRARSFNAMKACDKAIADYAEVIRLDPKSAEAYSIQASLYADCPDARQRNPQKAIAAAQRAIALDDQRPTFLTILATAYASDRQWKKAIAAQRQALAAPQFPAGYRGEAESRLKQYEQALGAHKAPKR